eukprot:CAMPEP_0184866766 /NCGR_PEP_ID=MMETSP0580-20130426/23608_1 /TAXON_ID=1118495 /ORGANISM="Dactyliosolen fragilissimus" /LENGTH=258 /DNA_ID=CAMNT_0027366615 /DNA_START=71 /DNA_END=845 /DNA_ORIENTATION=-
MISPKTSKVNGETNDASKPSPSLLISSFDNLSTDGPIQLILASQSPRRREILDMMGLGGKYTAQPSPLDESALQVELKSRTSPPTPTEYVQILAEQKARALGEHILDNYRGNHDETKKSITTLLIGSDTIVDLDGTIMEKPNDEAEAVHMLTSMSGRWHLVHTGVALVRVSSGKCETISISVDSTRVKFATLTNQDVKAYVSTGEPMDKAGSYGIQGIGGQLVETIEGDFFSVMGLPMHGVAGSYRKLFLIFDANITL